jgi:hypothetical protein
MDPNPNRGETDSLHVVERVEERIDEPGRHLEDCWELGLEQVVVVLVLARGELEVLLNLGHSESARNQHARKRHRKRQGSS